MVSQKRVLALLLNLLLATIVFVGFARFDGWAGPGGSIVGGQVQDPPGDGEEPPVEEGVCPEEPT